MTEQQIRKYDSLASRILLLSPSGSKQAQMAIEIMQNIEEWDEGKINRWIGYAQCLQVACGEQTLEETKDATRIILNAT